MKARFILFYFILFYCFIVKAQINLVPNYSFEQIDSCPDYVSKIALAQPWFSAYHSEVSTDLFDTCNHNLVGIPNNIIGHQLPKTGKSYSGIACYDGGNPTPYREYLEVRLMSQLLSGKIYCVTYNVSLAGNSYYAISNMGVKFTQDSLNIQSLNSNDFLLNVPPSIENGFGNHLFDTLGWMRIEGQYMSAGNENFITIGNFRDDLNSDTIIFNYNQFLTNNTYYYIDDVSVVEVSSANAGTDTTICAGAIATIGGQPTFEATYNWYAINGSGNMSIDSVTIAKPHVDPTVNTSYVMEKKQCNVTTYDTVVVNVNCIGVIEYLYNKNKEAVYPNPNNGLMNANIHLNYAETGELQIMDIAGKKIASYSLIEGTNNFSIDKSDLAAGVYFYNVLINGKIINSNKLIILHE